MRQLSLFGVGLVVILSAHNAVPNFAHGALIAFDNAADAAYSDGWQPGDNGGSGWGAGWTFLNQTNVTLTATNGSRGWITSDSRNNNSPAGAGGDSNGDFDINTPSSGTGKAWGIYSNATDHVYAVRPLATPLQIGQTISFDFDNGNVAGGQVLGVRFVTNAADVGSRVFEIRHVGGDAQYSLISTPNAPTTVNFTREGVHVEYTLTSATTYSLKVTRLQDGFVYNTTGTNSAPGAIAAIALKNQLAGGGGASDGYFNNIQISTVPEPAMGVGLLGTLSLARRRVR